MDSFSGRIALVTGGGSGIGRELVRQLCAQGCHVALCDLSQEAMQETVDACDTGTAGGVRITTHQCDVSEEADLERLRDEVLEQHVTDHINLLFNNAGISGGQSFINDPREQWDRTFAICWGGVYLGCRVFLPLLLKADAGHIINTSSVNGFWACLGPTVEHTAYSAAKFAVKGFTEALLTDMRLNAPHIGVSVVMPGHIGTSIAANTNRMWMGEPQDMDADAIERTRSRWARIDPGAAELPDDAVREMVRVAGENFRDGAPTTAAQAATTILDGVREKRWRILVGDDAVALDKAVRGDPAGAYEPEFVSPFGINV